MIPLCERTIYNFEKQGKFPLRIALSSRKVGSTPFSRTLTRRPIKAMRSVHVKAQEVHCRVQAWRG
ncbi:AlpA family phage regulatory protein [Xanthomonas citri]|uniref:AlpA family phage regulatory protein n=1 Tax=Xanthomonas TaxID=338 RepID=UPI003CCE86AA